MTFISAMLLSGSAMPMMSNKGARQCHNEQKDRAQQRIAEAVAKANQQISALDHFQIIRKLPDGGKMKAHAV